MTQTMAWYAYADRVENASPAMRARGGAGGVGNISWSRMRQGF
jgi:hypothetical protein